MKNKKILNIHKPLLKSYLTNNYQKVSLEGSLHENYFLNQSEDLWDALCSEEEANFVREKYETQNRSITLKEYHNLFSSLVNTEKFKNNIETLNKIYNDVSILYRVVKKMDELGLSYSLDITGGAVRDFINDKPIKDLDIMLSIHNSPENEKVLNKLNDIIFLKQHFSKDAIIYYIDNILVDNIKKQDLILKKQQLMTLCFQDLIAKQYTFTSSNKADGTEYNAGMLKKNRLLGVFKLDDQKMKLNYPIDILLTDFNKRDFLKDFDFDICKTTFSLINSKYNTEFPKDALELISRFSAERDFWADIHNKKITMNVDNMNEFAIENSIKKHFKRIKEKYPDFELNVISSEQFSDNQKYAMYIYLQQEAEIKDDNNKKFKI